MTEQDATPTVPRILGLALRIGEQLLASGSGVGRAVSATSTVVRAYGLCGCATDASYMSLTVSYRPDPDSMPMTEMRVVGAVSQNFHRIRQLDDLVVRIRRRGLTVADAESRLRRITAAADPYSRWATTLAGGGLGGLFTVMLGGGFVVFAVTFVVSILIDLAGRWLRRAGIPVFYRAVIGGTLATAAGVGCATAGWTDQAALIIAGGIAALLPGLSFVGGVQDAINGYLITAAARIVDAVMITVGLVAGVGAALTVLVRVGAHIPALLATGPGLRDWSALPVQVGAAAVVCATFALLCQASPLNMLTAAAVGAAGWAGYLMLSTKAGFSPTAATAMAAMVIGFSSQWLARWTAAPALLHLVVGIIPLAPGYAIYSAMFFLSRDELGPGMARLAEAIGIGLAVAAGSGFGQTVAGARGRLVRARHPSAG